MTVTGDGLCAGWLLLATTPRLASSIISDARGPMASSQQRVVNSVREFAASRASHEERQRSNRQMFELLRLDKLEEAQRRMAELAR